MSSENEEWRPWPRDPRWSVSNKGRVKSHLGRIVKGESRGKGKGSIVRLPRGLLVQVKRMVWHTFVADEDVQIAFVDGDKTNCAVENLMAHDQGRGQALLAASQTPALTEQQVARCIELYKQGLSMFVIGQQVAGVSGLTVANAFQRHGVTSKQLRKERAAVKVQAELAHSEQVAGIAVTLYESGMSWGDVCEQVGVGRHTISKHLRAAGHCSKRLARERKKASGINEANAMELGLTLKQLQEKAFNLFASYGITVNEYVAIKRSQSGKCAGCQEPLGPERTVENAGHIGGTYPAVDHCHRTGGNRQGVRGILHASCNSTLGMHKDNPERLRRLARYAERTRDVRPMRNTRPKAVSLPGLH
jgi:hypothetical protein